MKLNPRVLKLNSNESDPACPAKGKPAARVGTRGWVGYIVRFAVSVSVLVLLLRSVSWSEISAAMAGADHRLILAGCCLTVPIVFLKGFKWWLLLHHAGIVVQLRSTALSYMAGMGFGLVTPGRVGELARIWILGLPKEDCVVAGVLVLVDRLTDLVALLCLLAFSLLFFFGAAVFAAYVAVGAVCCCAWLLLARKWRPALEARVGSRGLLWKAVHAIMSVRPSHLGAYVLVGLVVTFCGITMVYVFLNAMQRVAYRDCLVALPPVFMNSILPVTVGGIGVRELLMTLVSGRLGIQNAVALSAILIYFTASMLVPGMLGLALAASRPRTRR